MKARTALVETGRKTVNISNKTYEDLTALGRMNETYDDVIARLIKYYKDHARRDNGR